MGNIKKALALVLALSLICCLPVGASAAGVEDATIDYNKTASLDVYKYDLTQAVADGAWNTDSYVSNGVYDQSVIDALGGRGYAVEGVEFTYLRVADIFNYTREEAAGEHRTVTLFGFERGDRSTAFLNVLGLGYDDAYYSADGVFYYISNELSIALANALNTNATTTKNALESFIKTNGGAAMPVTDEYGHSAVSGLTLGLYIVVETRVPDMVTSTCNPFFVSLPMTTIDGDNWNYAVTVYPKNQTGLPTLEKFVREAKADTGNNSGGNAIDDGYKHTATASGSDVVEYQILSTLPTITSNASALTEYSFEDKLPKGIHYNKGDMVIEFYRDKACTDLVVTWDEASGKFAVGYSDMSDGTMMKITMSESGLAEINTGEAAFGTTHAVRGYSDCTMRIKYACTLNSDASLIYGDSGNTNTVTLTWRRTNTEHYDTLKSDAHVYSYGVDLTKQFSDGAGKFENVKFVLQNKTDNYYIKAELKEGVYYVTDHVSKQAEATVFVPDKTGHIIVKGMEDDVYVATEVNTDDGYTLLKNNIEISITAAESGECPVCHAPLLTASAAVNGTATKMSASNALAALTVVNVKGFELPKTGSYGTWMFTAGGILIMGAAVFVMAKLLRKKKSM